MSGPAPQHFPAAPSGRSRRTGARRLKIGDEWMAIQIIARSQSNPQKAVAELVENSIDAGAKRIVITRGLRRGKVFLRVSDDGRGVPLGPEGLPDFDYVATHICDSLKRRLEERQRSGVQGEFGIGLLGFWSIGRELEMISQSGEAPACLMTMRAGSRSYERRRYLGARSSPGVDVAIREVYREVQSRLTADKLQRYLGDELRERIRRAGVTIVLEDRLPPRKILEVRPTIFKGERIEEVSEIPVPDHPPIRAELYVLAGEPGSEEPERPAVGLYRLGSRVCRDISTLPEFASEPWSGGRLEGALDYPDFGIAPASREGFAPDPAYHAFVRAVRGIEPLLMERLRLADEARAERASRALLRELQSAFARLLRDLPTGEYDWFGTEGPRPFVGGGDGRPGGPAAVPGGTDLGAGAAEATSPGLETRELEVPAPEAEVIESGSLPQPALVSGPLERVAIRPATVRVAMGRRRSISAVPLDASGLWIGRSLDYSWNLSPGVGMLAVETGGRATLEAGGRPARGRLVVRVVDRSDPSDPRERWAEAEVLIEAEAPRRAFPPPDFVHAHGESWRSRWNAAEARLQINSGHPDYQAVRLNSARRRRYLGRLYAKELVLHNFGHESPATALERLLEVLTRLDEHL